MFSSSNICIYLYIFFFLEGALNKLVPFSVVEYWNRFIFQTDPLNWVVEMRRKKKQFGDRCCITNGRSFIKCHWIMKRNKHTRPAFPFLSHGKKKSFSNVKDLPERKLGRNWIPTQKVAIQIAFFFLEKREKKVIYIFFMDYFFIKILD